MRIAIDASRTTVARITGTERYALELLRALIRHNTDHELILYFRDEPAPGLLPESPRTQMRVIPLARAWTHARFAAALYRDHPDVTFVPAHTLPFVFPGRAAVTVHDLGYKHFPQAHPWQQRLYLDLTTRYSARRANVVLADSQATAADLTRFYGTPADKIVVVYPGVDAPPLDMSIDDARQQYGLPERYFLFMGTLQPRKNIARIVRAYAAYRSMTPDPAGLVLAGNRGWLFDEGWLHGVDGVQVTGYIDEAAKGALYAGALALVFPSLYEGFGFPVIEAMHCGTPVIASETSSLPELVGDAGLLVNPDNTQAIAEALLNLHADESLRAMLIARGTEQSAYFTWDRAAAAALDALQRAAAP